MPPGMAINHIKLAVATCPYWLSQETALINQITSLFRGLIGNYQLYRGVCTMYSWKVEDQ